jgi:tRNA uridine 5-carbamoylmethylation protein Kti12
MRALEMRFEEPNLASRWDSPLFTVQIDDDIDFSGIENALYQTKAPTPNKSTLNVSQTK